MDAVIRGIAVYLFLLLIFRLSGRQTLSEMSNFDFVLLLIISETTQEAMVDSDHSLTNSFLLIMTLIGTTLLFTILKQKFPRLQKVLESTPVVIVREGQLLKNRMRQLRISEDDILEAARETQGLERIDQIKYAIVESKGNISIIPQRT